MPSRRCSAGSDLAGARDARSTAGPSSSRPARRALVEQLKTHGLDGFGLETAPGGGARGRRAGALPARDAEGRPRPRPRDRLPRRRRLPADRSDDDAESGGDRVLQRDARGIAAARDRSHGHADGRPAAARPGCCARCVSIERIQDRLDAVEEFAFRTTERAKVRDTFKAIHDIERLVGRAALGTAGPRDLVSLRQSLAAVPRVKLLLDDLQAPLVSSLIAELDDLTDIRQAARGRRCSTSRRSSPATAASFATASIPSSTSCGHQPIRQAAHRRDGGRRARADRDRVAEDPLQPRLRVLHRDLEVEPRERADRLSPQADDCRRRALHHARR